MFKRPVKQQLASGKPKSKQVVNKNDNGESDSWVQLLWSFFHNTRTSTKPINMVPKLLGNDAIPIMWFSLSPENYNMVIHSTFQKFCLD